LYRIFIKILFDDFSEVREYKLPLWFTPGNRYKLSVSGLKEQTLKDGVISFEVVWKETVEFRAGEGLRISFRLSICYSLTVE